MPEAATLDLSDLPDQLPEIDLSDLPDQQHQTTATGGLDLSDLPDKINLVGEPRGGFEEFWKGLDLANVPKDILLSITPAVPALQELWKTGGAIGDVIGGKPIEAAAIEQFPESQQFVGIEQKPLRERLATGLSTLMNLAFGAKIGADVSPMLRVDPRAVAAARTEASNAIAREMDQVIPAQGSESVAADEAIAKIRPADVETQTYPELPGAVYRVPSQQIATRPELMQFKEMDNAAAGTARESQITTPYDPIKAGNLLLWEPVNPQEYGLGPNEKYIVANGHYRNEAAQQQGVGEQNAQIIRESAGVSAADARGIAAWANIADGKGTVYDQARFIRSEAERGGPDAAVVRAREIGARSRKAESIAINGAPDLYTSFINEQITPEIAASIADAAPGNAGLQRLGIQRAIKGDAPNDIQNFLQATQAKLGDVAPQAAQVDLFAADDVAIKEAEDAARRAGAIQREIGEQINAVAGAAKRPEKAAALGVNVNDPAGVNAKLQELRALRERARSWASDPQIRELAMRTEMEAAEAVKQLSPEPQQLGGPGTPGAGELTGLQRPEIRPGPQIVPEKQAPKQISISRFEEDGRVTKVEVQPDEALHRDLSMQEGLLNKLLDCLGR